MKRCAVCGQELPQTDEYFPRHPRTRDGLAHWCRPCNRAYHRKWKATHLRGDSTVWTALLAKRKEQYRIDGGQAEKRRTMTRAKRDPIRARALRIRRTMTVHSAQLGVPFDREWFTPEQISRMLAQQITCECCGRDFEIGFQFNGTVSYAAPTADRVDNTRGYERDNVALICWRCNSLKSDASLLELESLVAYIQHYTTPTEAMR